MERTLILLKPDCMQRRLAGDGAAPLRAEGPAAGGLETGAGEPDAGGAALRRPQGQAVLRLAVAVLDRGADGGAGAGGPRGGGRGPQPDRRRPTAPRRRRARSAATSASACRTTSSTAATARTTPRRKSPCGSSRKSWWTGGRWTRPGWRVAESNGTTEAQRHREDKNHSSDGETVGKQFFLSSLCLCASVVQFFYPITPWRRNSSTRAASRPSSSVSTSAVCWPSVGGTVGAGSVCPGDVERRADQVHRPARRVAHRHAQAARRRLRTARTASA